MPEPHIRDLLRERILTLDGAMGTMIQRYKLDEAAFRGERFKDWNKDLKGHNDLLNVTQPVVIEESIGSISRPGRISSRRTRSTPIRVAGRLWHG